MRAQSLSSIQAEPYAFELAPTACALLIIDMQRDFLEPGGFGAMLGNDVAQLRATVAPNQRLLAAWRARGLTVIHTREGSGLGPDIELSTIGGFVVALGSKSGVSLVDPSTGQLTRVDCGACKPSHAQALQTPGILYFEDEERGGLLLDVSTGGPPRIVPLAGIDGRRNQ